MALLCLHMIPPAACSAGMYNLMTIQPVMSAERTVFYRERSSSYYSPGPYAIASGVVELPYLLAQSTLMVVIVYW